MKRSQLIGGAFHYSRWPLSHFLDEMNKLGIEAIEFYAASPHLYPDDYTRGMAKTIRRQLDDAGIKVEVITAEQCLLPISICASDYNARERSLRMYEKTLELGYELGAHTMQLMGGYYLKGEDKNFDELDRLVKEGIYRVTSYAKDLGMEIILEADPPSAIKNCRDIRKFLDYFKMDNLHGMIDFGASYTCGEDFTEAVEVLGDELRHIHLNDVKGEEPCFCAGRGDIPLYDWFDILDAHGYQGTITPEYWGTKYQFEADEVMEETVTFFEKYLAERNS